MSTIPAYLDPHNPLYYAPRHLRHERDAQPRSFSEPTAQAGSKREPYDHLLEQAVADALRDPPDASEFLLTSDYTLEPSRLSTLAGVALRFSTALGSLVIIALFVAWVIPFSSYASRTSSSANTSATAASTSSENATGGFSLADARSRFIPRTTETAQQSDNLLQQFVQWQQKPSAQYATGSLSK